MGGGFSLERFKAGMARNLQRLTNKIPPIGARLRQLSNTSRVGLSHLRSIPWQILARRHLPLSMGLGALLLLFMI